MGPYFTTIVGFIFYLCLLSGTRCQTYSSLPINDTANFFKWFQLPPQVNNMVPGSIINQGCICEIFNDTFYVFGKNYYYWNMSIYSFDFVANSWSLVYFSNSDYNSGSSSRWMSSPVHDANFINEWWMHDGNYVSNYQATYATNGLIVNPSGASANMFTTFLKFSFDTNQLSVIPNINDNTAPAGRENSPLVRYKDSLWLFGMCGPDASQDQELWYYTVGYNASQTDWTQVQTSPKPLGRCGHTFNGIPDTTFGLIFGGHFTLKNGYLNDLWKFDFETQNFTQLNATGVVPLPRAYHVSGYYDGLLLIYSGDGDSFLFFDDLWGYSIANNFWINIVPLGTTPTIPIARMQATGLIYQNNLIVYGGKKYGPDPITGFEVTQPLNDLWVFKLGCPNDCSGNGNCSELECTCNACYVGQDCSTKICSTYNPTNVGVLVGIIVGSISGICLMVGLGAFINRKANKYRKAKLREKALSAQQQQPQQEEPNPFKDNKSTTNLLQTK